MKNVWALPGRLPHFWALTRRSILMGVFVNSSIQTVKRILKTPGSILQIEDKCYPTKILQNCSAKANSKKSKESPATGSGKFSP